MRRKAGRIGFKDMPAALRDLTLDAPAELKRQRTEWLEEHSLSFVDFLSWKRAQDPRAASRPPSSRKWLSPQARAELDARLEREGEQW